MATQTNYTVLQVETGDETPPSPSSSSPSTPRGWWSRPIVTLPASNNRNPPTFMHGIFLFTPFFTAIFTVFAVEYIFSLIDQILPHVNFSIQSIDVSPSMWQVNFLVKNPNSRYVTYFDGDYASVRLGPLKAAVLNASYNRRESRDVTFLSLVFVAEDRSGNDVVSEQLDVKLRGLHKRYIDYDEAGYFDVQCHNLNRSHEKIICQSSFTPLKMFLN